MLTTRKFDVNTEQVGKCFEQLVGQVVQAVGEQRPLHEVGPNILAGVLKLAEDSFRDSWTLRATVTWAKP